MNSLLKKYLVLFHIAMFLSFSLVTLAQADECWSQLSKLSKPATFILSMGANTNGLTMAAHDAKRFAAAMKQRLPDAHVCTLTQVRKSQMERALEHLKTITKSTDQVFIYFSGHGTFLEEGSFKQDEADCLDEALVPVYQGEWEREAVRDDTLVRWVNALPVKPANICVFLDTCFASSMRRASCTDNLTEKFFKYGRMPDRLTEFRGKECPSHQHLHQLKGILYAASGESESAWEIKGKGGRFTYQLLNILESNQGKLSMSELDAAFTKVANDIFNETQNTECIQQPQRWPSQ